MYRVLTLTNTATPITRLTLYEAGVLAAFILQTSKLRQTEISKSPQVT